MSTAQYRQLPGRSKAAWGALWLIDLVFLAGQGGLAASHRMYEGADHLLLVEDKFFNETVRRFYFGDIQAIVVRRTQAHAAMNLVLGLLILLVSIFAAVRLSQDMNMIALAAVSVVEVCLLLLLAANLWLGPTCRTELFTAVHRQPLLHLRRWRAAAAFVRHVEPLARSAQPGAAVEYASDTPAEHAPWTAAQHSSLPKLLQRQAVEPVPDFRLPALFFTLLIACSISSLIDTVVFNNWKNSADAVMYTATLVCGSIGLGQIRCIERLGALRNLLGAGIALMIVMFYAAQFVLMADMFSQIDPESPTKAYQMPSDVTPFMIWYAVFSVFVYGTLGVLGLRETGNARRYTH